MTTQKTYQGPVCKRGHSGVRFMSGCCIVCHPVLVARWEARHKDRRKAIKAKYRAVNREKERAKQAALYAADPDKYCAIQKRYRERNPHKVLQHTRSRRARLVGAIGRGVTGKQWSGIVAASLGLCAYCNESRPLTQDHIDPLSKGGEHDMTNVAAVCASCNSSKGKMPFLAWLAWRRG